MKTNINNMKRIKHILLSAIIILIASCKPDNNTATTPGEVAVTLFTAITSGDVQYVKDNICFADSSTYAVFSDYLDIAVASEQYKKKTSASKAEYHVAEENIDGDVAMVVLSGITPLGQPTKITVKLLNVDGAWKVDGEHGVWHNTTAK